MKVITFKGAVGWCRWGYEVVMPDGTRLRPFPLYKYGTRVHARAAGLAHGAREKMES